MLYEVITIGLPGIDGWAVMNRIKNDPELRHIPVHFMSGKDESLEAMKMGVITSYSIHYTKLYDCSWLKEIHCEVTIDEMGNIFGRRPGRNRELPVVMSGSHIDSQPKGGRFDGIFGVMGALEVMRTLHENGRNNFV